MREQIILNEIMKNGAVAPKGDAPLLFFKYLLEN